MLIQINTQQYLFSILPNKYWFCISKIFQLFFY